MEKNTVALDIDRYNELYNLEKATKDGKKLLIEKHYGFSQSVYTYFYTDNEIIKDLTERCEKLEKENKGLERKAQKLEAQIPTPEHQPSIEEIKKMNYWQFRKWRDDK